MKFNFVCDYCHRGFIGETPVLKHICPLWSPEITVASPEQELAPPTDFEFGVLTLHAMPKIILPDEPCDL